MTAADVSVVTETLPGSQVGLTIEVPSEQVDRAYDRALNRLAQRVRIGGFRPGKAPRPLLEARLGAAAIRDEVVDTLVPGLVNQALLDHKIDAIDRPRVEVQEMERGRPGRFTARVSVMPEVVLPELPTLQVDRSTTTVDDEMVERRLKELRERLAEVEPVEREVRAGDIVVADLRVLVDGEEAPSESRKATEVEVAEGAVIPELLAVLPGRAVGEVATADVTLPEEHTNPDLRGKAARLEITVQGVKEKRVPELTDSVASELSNGEHATADALRDAVQQDLVDQARRLDELSYEQAAVKAVVDASQIELPEALVAREVERQVEDLERSLQRRGLRLDRYLEYVGKTEAEYRADLQPDAEGRIRVDLVLEELGRRMAIAPTEPEVVEYMRSEAERDEEVRKELDSLVQNPVAIDYFRHRLTRLKVLEGLVAQVTAVPVESPAGANAG
ncbi:MAG TPA: trigger factor [Candidatus Dormibacteraeota bacterium]|nr:trigger factor [Candidatus Dormibacteraeota bacterium]